MGIIKQPKQLIKVAITGPESTGKSWLTKCLAQHYHGAFVEEFARKYLDSRPQKYEESDLEIIARGQMEALWEAEHNHNIVFCDTEMLVMKIWYEYKYGECHPFVLEMLHQQNFDLYLLCDTDLPWHNDPQREYPHLRRFFFDWFASELSRLNFPFKIISGIGELRLQAAIDAVEVIKTSRNMG